MDSLLARISIPAGAYADNFKMVADVAKHTDEVIQSNINAVYN